MECNSRMVRERKYELCNGKRCLQPDPELIDIVGTLQVRILKVCDVTIW